jgi:hypothetical protein
MGLFKDADMTVAGSRRAMRGEADTIDGRRIQWGTRLTLSLPMYVHDSIICTCARHWESRSSEAGQNLVATVGALCRTVRGACRWGFRSWMMSSLISSNDRVPALTVTWFLGLSIRAMVKCPSEGGKTETTKYQSRRRQVVRKYLVRTLS